MRCHYEVLGVSESATEDDLKKAYKKLALQWHPDKNTDNVVEAKKKFLEIRAAYEVLSDPRERAWYDDHRDVMLNRTADDDYEDDTINIFPFFTASCYQGYDDSENSFYTVYRNLFKDIAKQDLIASGDKTLEIPDFGTSQSDYDEVVGPFYAYWSSYYTLKSYVWVEEHDTRDARERRIRRLMEQENKKTRDKAKKKRNEEVRELVAFVKKRDKRVQLRKTQLEEQAAQKKKANEEKRLREKQKRLDELSQYKDSQWMSFDEFEKQLDELEKATEETKKKPIKTVLSPEDEALEQGESDDEDEDFYCVACNKSFKSDKAFLNHENSRKHKELVQLMKEHMQQENEELILGEDQTQNLEPNESFERVSLPVNDQTRKSKKKKKKQKRNKKNDDSSDEADDQETTNLDEQEENVEQNEDSASNSNKAKVKTKSSTASKNENDEISAQEQNLQCFVCKEEFSSRNALFKHIKELDHAKPITMTNMKPILLLVPKSMLKSFSEINELPLSYRHLNKGRQFSVGDQKFRARREKNSSSEFFCFQKGNKGTDAEFISSSVETFSVTQDIDPPTECTPQVVTFRPEFPTNLKTRCLPFGADEPKKSKSKSKHKKLKRLND